MFTRIMQDLPVYLLRLPCILLALTVHETAHGWVAHKMGDDTARNFGRLTLNPLKHIDPIGALCMIFFGIGWAKPVPVNARNFRNPRKGMALTALAGPVSNLLLAFLGILMERIWLVAVYSRFNNNFTYVVWLFLTLFYMLNLSLAVFNMIPIPPFDGSRILFIFLPDKLYFGIMKYERIIMLVLLVLLWTGVLSIPITYVVNLLARLMFWIVGWLPFL